MTQSTESGTIWLTSSAHEQLKAELENLKGPVREEIVARISEARDEGDLKENGGYHAAREEQGKNEGNIRLLEDTLLKAVSDPAEDDGVVTVGKVVTIRYQGDDDTETFLLGARENEDYVDVTVYSPQAPLGEALLGATKGDTVGVRGPERQDAPGRRHRRRAVPGLTGRARGSLAAVGHAERREPLAAAVEGGQHPGAVGRQGEGVLVVGRPRPVGGHHRPVVLEHVGLAPCRG